MTRGEKISEKLKAAWARRKAASGPKRCSKCGSEGPFYRRKSRPGGLSSHCQECIKKELDDYRKEHLGEVRKRGRARYHFDRKKFQGRLIAMRLEKKVEVLSYYGPDGRLQCSWEGCGVTDVDMLTIDHVGNDGGKARKAGESHGYMLYAKLANSGFPSGYQTLCMNHQVKKELVRKRMIREDGESARTGRRSTSGTLQLRPDSDR